MIKIVLNIIMIIVFLAFIYYMYKNIREVFWLYFLLIFMHIWLVLSSAYIEKGIYITEEQLISSFTGATFRLIILELVMFLSIYITSRYLLRRMNSKKQININDHNYENKFKVFLLIAYGIIFVLLFNVIISGNIITNSNITRFNFWSTYAKLKFAFNFQIIQYELQLINGLIFSVSKNKNIKNLSLILFILTIVYYLLIGTQFTGFFYITLFFLVATLMKMRKILSIKNAIVLIVLIILILTPKLKFFEENNTYGSLTNTPMESLLYRGFVLQGHTWWGTDFRVQNNIIYNKDQVNNEIQALINPDENKYNAGIWYLMQQVAPHSIYNQYLLGNGTFNSGYPAINVAIFGFEGAIIFQIINGVIFALLTIYLYKQILKRKLIRIFLVSILYYHYYEYLFMGNISNFGNKTPVISFVILTLILTLEKISAKKFKIVR